VSIERQPQSGGPTDLYLIPDWVRVRKESFGLLFYDTRSTKLTFVRSGDSLEPPAFFGGARVLRVVAGAEPAGAARPASAQGAAGQAGGALERLMDTLVAKGLVVARAE
jgi:putative mycofactocin binding protein MftB